MRWMSRILPASKVAGGMSDGEANLSMLSQSEGPAHAEHRAPAHRGGRHANG